MANSINIGGGAGGSSGGGHTILDNSGTSLTQRTELQFKGAYSEDNSTDGVTEVNVVREMTKAEFDLLTNDEKAGIINVTDERGSADRNYSETTLWSGSETTNTSGTQITLSDNISNYDEIVIYANANNSTDYGSVRFLVSNLTIGEIYIQDIYAPNNCGVYFVYDTDTAITVKALASVRPMVYTKVVGIKYGNGTQTFHNYSTAEQVVGTWIDGKTVYEKTVSFVTPSSNAYTRQSLGLLPTDIDAIWLVEGCAIGVNTIVNVTGYTGNVASEEFMGFIYKESTSITFDYRVGSSLQNGNAYLTIRYTKT